MSLNWPIDENNTPKPGDVGVIVCEPVPDRADATQASFGAGCARWLQFVIGGQGELAQTPTWTTIDRGRQEMHSDSLRLVLDETPDLARKTGATHCVVGEIGGTAGEATFTLAIGQVDTKQQIGKSWIIHGSRDQIVEKLPSVAREIAAHLGVLAPAVPAAVECKASDLAFLGSLPWLPPHDLPQASVARLSTLARTVPLAALLALAASDPQDQAQCEALVRALVTEAPNNAVVFGGLAYLYRHGCISQSGALDALRARYPRSYQLAAAQVMRVRGASLVQETQAARALVQYAPRDPEAWISAGSTIGNIGENLRQGRYSALISSSEYASLNKVYAEWLSDVKKAADLDPEFARAWARVATAATFTNDRELADKAFWTALALDPEEKDTLEWGLQMYQPKWFNDPAKLLDVAHRAAEAFHWDTRVYGIAREIEAGGQPLEARRMRNEALKQQRAAATARPNDFTAQSNFAWGLKQTDRYAEGEQAFRSLLQRFRADSENKGNVHEGLAGCLMEQGKKREAIAEYEQAVKKYPDKTDLLRELGYAYRQNVEPLKAIATFQKAMRIDGGNANAWGIIGDAYLDARKGKEAVDAYRKSLHLDPNNILNLKNLSIALGLDGKYAEGVDVAEQVLAMDPNNLDAHQSLAYLYGLMKKHDKSAEECRIVLQAQPNDPVAHANLGEALLGLGRKPEARKELETAVRLDPGGRVGKEARDMLARHP